MTTQIEAKIEAILEDYRTWKQHLRKILEKHLKKEKEKIRSRPKIQWMVENELIQWSRLYNNNKLNSKDYAKKN